MRYTGKFRFPGRSSFSSSPTSSDDGTRGKLTDIIPGRLSVDENKLRQRSYSRTKSDHSFSDDSECSDMGSPFISNSPASYMAPTLSSRKSAIEKVMKKANSLSKWGSSASRPESPPTPTSTSFSRSKPPTSPSKKGKKNFLHMGLDLIKSKKNGSDCLSPLGSGMGMVESVHQLRMMHGSWMRWRYANARANVANETLEDKVKKDLLHVWENMAKLQQSVLQKKLRLEKEKLEMKLNFILHAQMKMLEGWRDIERKHTSNVLMTKDCLEGVACKIPLIEGAKMDPQTSLLTLRHATDLVAAVMSTMSSLMPTAYVTVSTFSELAKVMIEEKLLLEECLEHFRVISALEIEERSLRCNIIEFASFDNQQ
ncbi:hypothetical protein L2E82_15639 [Cichorium intybus]|uniref:Uncharacterized protein n=1 Tax=Cichorium intybus TaxID=13427 RepID=A0ACB9F3T5_CICIN|nr:hypothetical protein L2E82_15639 [Cichorium intybus]